MFNVHRLMVKKKMDEYKKRYIGISVSIVSRVMQWAKDIVHWIKGLENGAGGWEGR